MLRSSHGFARRILLSFRAPGTKTLSTSNAILQKASRLTSEQPLTLLAVAGTALTTGFFGMVVSNDDDIVPVPDATTTTIARAAVTAPTDLRTTTTTYCDDNQVAAKRESRLNRTKTTRYDPSRDSARREAKLNRKKTVLKVAASLERLDTKQQVSRLRRMKTEILTRWERDEEGWRELPSRAWPEYQPNPKALEKIRVEVEHLGCIKKVLAQTDQTPDIHSPELSQCTLLLFHMATSLVFYNIDNEAGLALYERLAKLGHADSMVACGIVLVEGLGVAPREHEGLTWLEKAMEVKGEDVSSMASAQASYELGTIYYTGIDGIVEEDSEKAFEFFERAAKFDHTSALYMVADCLVEGEGVERNINKAIPLFYKAAERGHRYSRQRIRELLAQGSYPL